MPSDLSLTNTNVDVLDPNADATSQNVGSRLIVDKKYTFSDLDELIVNHVKAMARKVEEMVAHDKYQKGTESEIRKSFTSRKRAPTNPFSQTSS